MSHEHSQWLDRLAWASAGIAVVSVSQAAFILTIIATAISIVLGCFRIHDRIKFGPRGGYRD